MPTKVKTMKRLVSEMVKNVPAHHHQCDECKDYPCGEEPTMDLAVKSLGACGGCGKKTRFTTYPGRLEGSSDPKNKFQNGWKVTTQTGELLLHCPSCARPN